MVDITSFGDTMMALFGKSGRSTIVPSSWAYPGCHDDCASISSGSLTRFGKCGCLRSPDWDIGDDADSDSEESIEEKKRSEYDMWNVQCVLEGLLWVSVRVFLVTECTGPLLSSTSSS